MSKKLLNNCVIGLCLCLMGCSSAKVLNKGNAKTLDALITESAVFSKSFTGFMLYDPATKTTLYSQDADKYFTPASNTKIFTLYTSTQFLGDSLPILNYQISGDSLFFWGTGNPVFLHPYLPQNDRIINLLKQHEGPLFYSSHNYRDEHFGPGWAWDDFTYAFQAEKSPFPIHGNVVRFSRDSLQTTNSITVAPPHFKEQLGRNPAFSEDSPYFRRKAFENQFEHNLQALNDTAYQIEKPFISSPKVIAQLLSDTLGRSVGLSSRTGKGLEDGKTLYIPFPDTIYQLLMKDSDNFIAEQLLLMCADQQLGFIETTPLIDKAKQDLFADAPDELLWFDGSGLTRYNMFTPRTVVSVLEKLLHTFDREWLFSIFPGGGQAGTISKWYGNTEEPYVYAKTGTLSNKHCLSGYLLTDSGKTLIFSFMHNNFPTGSEPLKKEMEKILAWMKREL